MDWLALLFVAGVAGVLVIAFFVYCAVCTYLDNKRLSKIDSSHYVYDGIWG